MLSFFFVSSFDFIAIHLRNPFQKSYECKNCVTFFFIPLHSSRFGSMVWHPNLMRIYAQLWKFSIDYVQSVNKCATQIGRFFGHLFSTCQNSCQFSYWNRLESRNFTSNDCSQQIVFAFYSHSFVFFFFFCYCSMWAASTIFQEMALFKSQWHEKSVTPKESNCDCQIEFQSRDCIHRQNRNRSIQRL